MVHKRIAKTSRTKRERGARGHRFEHWWVDNQVYFITARCKGKTPAFASEEAKAVFWDRFGYYTQQAGFVPWVVSLMDNHYHVLGYNRSGEALKGMMRKLHGSVAKLVNDVLETDVTGAAHFSELRRLVPFWRDARGKEFFDGCIRDEVQCRRAYRYTLTQAVRHGVSVRWEDYGHTRVYIELERALPRAIELRALMPEVPYLRYGGRGGGSLK